MLNAMNSRRLAIQVQHPFEEVFGYGLQGVRFPNCPAKKKSNSYSHLRLFLANPSFKIENLVS